MRRDRWIPIVCVVLVIGGLALLVLLSRARSSSPSRFTVRVANSTLGRFLVDRNERTLYLYTRDRPNESVCVGTCTQVWPPSTSAGRPTAGSGVSAAKLTTIRRPDSASQLVYNGHPLYTFSGETRPGQMDGESFLGVWYLVSPAGNQIKKAGVAAPPAY